MDQGEITEVVNCIRDFIHKGNNIISRRTAAVRCFLEHLQLNSTDIFEKVAKTLQTNQKNIGESPSKEWTCLPQDANSPNKVNNNINTRLDSGVNPEEEQLLKRENHTHQNNEAKIAEEEKKQMQANIELAN